MSHYVPYVTMWLKKNPLPNRYFAGGFLINEDCSPHRHIDHIGMHIDETTKKYLDGLTYQVIGVAIEVHNRTSWLIPGPMCCSMCPM